MSGAEERLVELEIQIAHQNQIIEDLSGEIARQGQDLARLQKATKALAERFLALEEVATPRPEITKPPHY
ncbi:SlyX family protein [Aureimonas ureilytica]|uniref:SlyX family protein n=1 Tax=Aureimonas ureilytica TaxID=401562 RepID=UPI00035D1810|nr:SlyX family protein [Aureimonas ureilytica]